MYPILEIKIDSASIINLNELRKFILNYIDGSKEISFFRIKSIVLDLKDDKKWSEILDEIKNHIDNGFSFSYKGYGFEKKLLNQWLLVIIIRKSKNFQLNCPMRLQLRNIIKS